MQDNQLAALKAARKQLDIIVQSTTYVVIVMSVLFLAMLPFFTGMVENLAVLIGILVVAGMLLSYLFKKRNEYLREYHRLIQSLEHTIGEK